VEGGWGDHSVRGVVGIPAERIVSYVLHAHHRATAAKVQPRGLRRLKFKIVFSFKTDKFLATISFNILHVIFIKKKSFSFEGGQIKGNGSRAARIYARDPKILSKRVR
jgi:hypothetical protein